MASFVADAHSPLSLVYIGLKITFYTVQLQHDKMYVMTEIMGIRLPVLLEDLPTMLLKFSMFLLIKTFLTRMKYFQIPL